MRRTVLYRVFGIGLALCAAGPSVGASEGQPEATYKRYCGACHGPAGKGDGIASSFMRPMPPDLTQLAAKAGGEFPALEVMKVIDGRETPRAHGDSEMPVWGEILSREALGSPDAVGDEVKNKLFLITEYLRSIQAK